MNLRLFSLNFLYSYSNFTVLLKGVSNSLNVNLVDFRYFSNKIFTKFSSLASNLLYFDFSLIVNTDFICLISSFSNIHNFLSS